MYGSFAGILALTVIDTSLIVSWQYCTVDISIVVALMVVAVKIVLVERCKIAENVTDFLLLDEFTVIILIVIQLTCAAAWKNHVLDELGYALAIDIVQDLADYALKECLIMKFCVFLSLIPSSFLIPNNR